MALIFSNLNSFIWIKAIRKNVKLYYYVVISITNQNLINKVKLNAYPVLLKLSMLLHSLIDVPLGDRDIQSPIDLYWNLSNKRLSNVLMFTKRLEWYWGMEILPALSRPASVSPLPLPRNCNCAWKNTVLEIIGFSTENSTVPLFLGN